MDGKVHRIIRLLQKKKIRIALAESVTCGLIASKLCTGKGTSDVLAGSIVCYAPAVKKKLLDVPGKMIRKYSAESMQVTRKLAKNLSKLIDADLYAAVTGLATDDPEALHPAGTIFLCVYDGKKQHCEKKHFRGSPLVIRKKACHAMFELIARHAKK
jgi:PncC family amidohydrolase